MEELEYRREEEMKDSGIEWLGKIPKEWGVKKLKYIFKSVKNGIWGNNEKGDDNDVFCIRVTNFNRYKSMVEMDNLTIRNLDKHKQRDYLLNKNDLLIEKSGGGDNQPVGFVTIYNSNIPAIYANFMARIVIKEENHNRYILYYFTTLYKRRINTKHINQTTGIQNINTTSYFDEKIAIPSINEQQKIANFLDYKTSQFDLIISKKEKLIEKLEEAKKSLISEVVTGKVKIVDGEMVERKPEEMKNSDVEWLGMIPKDWEVKRLKYLVKEPLQYGANEPAELDDRRLPRYIRITDFDENGELKTNTFKSLPYEKAIGYMLDEGDILFARSGATVGKTFQFKNYDGKACFAGYLIKARINEKKIKSDFMYYFTKSLSYENWKNSIFIQATIQNIGADKYKELKVGIPHIDEQEKVCKYLYKKIDKMKTLANKTKSQIQKLKEAKQSLISEAVTGKIDLMDWEIKEVD